MENVEFITKLKINLGFSGFKKILEISKIVKNWYMLPLFKSKIIKKVNITLVNGTFYFLGNDLDYKNFWNSNEAALAVAYKFLIKYSENKLFFDHLIFEYKTPEEFKNTIYMIRENFIYKQYSKLNVKGKVVLDIGGGIGDTAIYFYFLSKFHIMLLCLQHLHQNIFWAAKNFDQLLPLQQDVLYI